MLKTTLQAGFSLIELMVGITISLFILLAALTALVNTSSTGKTVNDASQLQQQGSIALRIIGLQIRQAAAHNLETITIPATATTVFLSRDFLGYAGAGNAIQGVDGGGATPDTLNLSYQGTAESADCLGNPSTINEGAAGEVRVDSSFTVNLTNQLVCTGSDGGGAQVIADGVEDFQVRYGVKNTLVIPKTIQYVNTTANWGNVSTVEVCLQLRSANTDNQNPVLGTYTNCQGNVVAQDRRLHKVFRNTFLLRNQDL